MFNEWCTIESDPGVFSQLIQSMGVPSVQVQEIYSLQDDELFTRTQPQIYGFIFLFKWSKELEKKEALSIYDQDLFFARQIVTNACATQAILSVVLNADLPICAPLKDFADFTKPLNCEDRGLALSNCIAIKDLHNSFCRAEPFIFKEDKKSKKKADAFHFVSYVPHKHHLYELDGLQPGPILIGQFDQQQEWIALAKKEIVRRIQHYAEKQIRFNLMVVCENLTIRAEKDIVTLEKLKVGLLKNIKNIGKHIHQGDEELIKKYIDVEAAKEETEEVIQNKINKIMEQIGEKQHFIQEQKFKSQERKQQNIKRKHNYVPLIIQMLKTLAKKNMLSSLVEKSLKK